MYLNGLSNPDAVVSLSNPNGYGSFIPHAWDISLGRWGLPFAAGANRCIAVKIVDDRGIESLKVMRLED